MALVSRLSVILTATLILTLSIKTFVAASVIRPSGTDIAAAVGKVVEGQGFQVAGPSTFAGRVATVAQRDDCLLYLVPVSEQGWHQETVRTGLTEDQHLYFLFRGHLYPEHQPRWAPLFSFYSSFAFAHAGVGRGYEPVIAVVASQVCDVNHIDWHRMNSIPYVKESLLSHYDIEDY